MPSHSIIVADRYPVSRIGLRHLLEAERDWEVVGDACDGLDAIVKVNQLRPHLAVLGADLNGPDSTQVAALIRAERSSTRLL